jgi:hypothetical protein
MTGCNGQMGEPWPGTAAESTVDRICGIFALVASQGEGSVYAGDGWIPEVETVYVDLEEDEALTVMSWLELVQYARRGDLAEFHAGLEAIRRAEATLVRRGVLPGRDSERGTDEMIGTAKPAESRELQS